MRIAIITACYPPMRNSGAIQVRDLANGFADDGHSTFVLYPDSTIEPSCKVDVEGDVTIIRMKCPDARDRGYIFRTLFEFLMPYLMWYRLNSSEKSHVSFDALVCYSPSIFFAPLIKKLKRRHNAPCYLIIRDLFPVWAVDLGLIRESSLVHMFFRSVESSLYREVEIIGAQAKGNLDYLRERVKSKNTTVEVLDNWLSNTSEEDCSIDLQTTILKGRKVFVYAGNMGIAQGLETLISMAISLEYRKDVGFLFIGRGSNYEHLKKSISSQGCDNILIYPEIEPSEIPSLYSQCHAGLLCLDRRHTTNNIPGKLLSYMRSSLPVLAVVNSGNDVIEIINGNKVGIASDSYCVDRLTESMEDLLTLIQEDAEIKQRCQKLADGIFSTQNAVNTIVEALSTRISRNNS